MHGYSRAPSSRVLVCMRKKNIKKRKEKILKKKKNIITSLLSQPTMLHTLLFSQSVPNARGGCAPDKAPRLTRTLSTNSNSNTPPPTSSTTINHLHPERQQEEIESHLKSIANMPAKNNRRKKASAKPVTEAANTTTVESAPTKPTLNKYAKTPNGKPISAPSSQSSTGGQSILSLISR